MGKTFELPNGKRASEANFFKVKSPKNLLMQPIENEERATRSGKLFSPEKFQENREKKKQKSSTSSTSSSTSSDRNPACRNLDGFNDKKTIKSSTSKKKKQKSSTSSTSSSTSSDRNPACRNLDGFNDKKTIKSSSPKKKERKLLIPSIGKSLLIEDSDSDIETSFTKRKGRVPRMNSDEVEISFNVGESVEASTSKVAKKEDDHQSCSVKPKCLKPWINPIEWVQCDGKCQLWFHLYCVGLRKDQLNEYEDYLCRECKSIDESQNDSFEVDIDDEDVETTTKEAEKSSNSSTTPTVQVFDPNLSLLDNNETDEEDELVIGLGDFDNFEEDEDDKKVQEKDDKKYKKPSTKPDVYKEDVTSIHVPIQKPTQKPEIGQRLKFPSKTDSKNLTQLSKPKKYSENLLAPIKVSSSPGQNDQKKSEVPEKVSNDLNAAKLELESHPEGRRMLKLVVLLLACLLQATTQNPNPQPQMGGGGGFQAGFQYGIQAGIGACRRMEGERMRPPYWSIRL